MLRRIRIFLAAFCFLGLTALFLDFTGTAHAWLGWLAQLQGVPAVLALNVGALVFLAVLTLLFGRVYCSILCPLGVFQDGVSHLAGMRKKRRFRFTPARTALRLAVLALFVLALAFGGGLFVALLDPYAAYGRMAVALFAPLYDWGNNLLAFFAERAHSYAFYTVDVWWKGAPVFAVALATFAVVSVLAWRGGRRYCNTICPVGTFLGFFSRFALVRPRIFTDKCNRCGTCARSCKAACIDAKTHTIDASRCVACMDCIDVCPQGAIRLSIKPAPKPAARAAAKPAAAAAPDASRRKFLSAMPFLAAAAAKPLEKKGDGGLAPLRPHEAPVRACRLVPAGAEGVRDFERKCTACLLCVAACPEHVLQPSADADGLLRPKMDFTRGRCRPDCTRCADVCPTGAIGRIDVAEKSAVQIGHAVWVASRCIVNVDGVSCDNCAAHCPTGAIRMMPKDPKNRRSPKIPIVDEARCIGCGACEHLCPASPLPAMYVEPHARHKKI